MESTTNDSSAACVQSELTAGLEPADGCQACKRLQSWARTAWWRGHRMGLLANERTAKEAMDALRREKAAHAETNARLTDALLKAEEQRDALQAALLEAARQAISKTPKQGLTMKWQRLETAPADGEWALVYADGAVNCMFVKRGELPDDWTRPDCPNVMPEYVTHWMPLPKPPNRKL